MAGVFDRETMAREREDNAARRESAHRAERAQIRAEGARVAARIEAEYARRMATPQSLEEMPRPRGYQPPYPWQAA